MAKITQLLMKSTFGNDLKTFDSVLRRRLEFVMQTFTIASLTFIYAFFKIVILFGLNRFAVMYAIETLLCFLIPLVYRFSKNVSLFVSSSVVMSYCILFYNNLALGGMNNSSGVLLWGIACISAGMMFYEKKKAYLIFLAYVGLCLFSAFIENVIFDNHMMKTINVSFVVINTLGIGSMIYSILGVFIHELNIEFEKSKSLIVTLQEQQEKLEEANIELEAGNHSLIEAMNNLQSAQSKIIQSEKMASLGRLIAGIAHEINTPVGAIKASAGYINSTISEQYKILWKIGEAKQNSTLDDPLLLEMIQCCAGRKDILSATDKRKLKRHFKNIIDEYNIEDSMSIASMLTEIGLTDNENDEQLIRKLSQSSSHQYILDTVYALSSVIRSSENILTATGKISKIVYALKNYAHQDFSDEMVCVSIVENIEVVLTLYYNQLKSSVEVIKEYDQIPNIYCYPDDLSQVWTNLIFNALQAMNNVGTLTIGVHHEDDYINISFSDTGCGIPPESLERIFQPFYTTKPIGEGSGLGLDICSKIIQKHNGEIKVDSTLGKGSTFTVKIPAKFQW